MATPKKPVTAKTEAGGLLPSGIAASENVLKNQYAAQWAFWHQDDVKNADGTITVGPLGNFLDKAIQGGWIDNATKFNLEFRKTDWYQKNGPQAIAAATDKYTNPTVWQNELTRRSSEIQNQSTALGYKLDANTITGLAETSLYQAYDATAWSNEGYQTQLRSKIVNAAKTAQIPISEGAALTNEQALRTYAQDMGVPMTKDFFTNAANSINDPSQAVDINAFKNQIRDAASSQYNGFGDLIGKGMTIRQIASPYIQSMANILEVPVDQIDFTKDQTIQKALGTSVAPGGVSQPMSLWQFNQSLRQDPRWAYTDNARDSVNGMARQVLKDFGMVS